VEEIGCNKLEVAQAKEESELLSEVVDSSCEEKVLLVALRKTERKPLDSAIFA